MMTDSNPSAGGDAGRHPAAATEQAVFLTALADHLLAHPDLPPVNITMRDSLPPDLHVFPGVGAFDGPDEVRSCWAASDSCASSGTERAAIAAWAASCGVTELGAVPVEGWHAVRFTALIGPGQTVEVWTRVTGLPAGDHTLRTDELTAAPDPHELFSHWHQVTSQGQPVYWRRRLPDGGWLAVHKPAGSRYWQWERHEPGSREAAQTVSGFDLSRPARDAADAVVPR